jgi:hypothetical protein
VGDHRHRRDRREARHPVRTEGLDGVNVRGRDHLGRLVPGRPDQTALAPGRLVAAGPYGIGHDLRPGGHGISGALPGLPVHLQQDAPHVGVADPGRRVGVPGERRSARASPGLVLRLVRPGRRIVGLLRLPGDDAVLDVHLPGARPGAVHPVRGSHDLVVGPAITVEGVGLPATDLVDGPEIL